MKKYVDLFFYVLFVISFNQTYAQRYDIDYKDYPMDIFADEKERPTKRDPGDRSDKKHRHDKKSRSNHSIKVTPRIETTWAFKQYTNGISYEKEGYVLFIPTGYIYIWSNDKFTGHGELTFPDKTSYIGAFTNNLFHGKGKFYSNAGKLIFDGNWENASMKHGTYYFDDDSAYRGSFNSNGQFNGNGTLQCSSRCCSYSGNWSNDKREGTGEMKTSEFSYKGQWKADKFHGKGIYQLKNATIYRSTTDKTGKTIFYEKTLDGSTYDGSFFNGQKSGYGVQTYPEGSYYKGNWSNDKKNGKGYFYYSCGLSANTDWVNGRFKNNASNLPLYKRDLMKEVTTHCQPAINKHLRKYLLYKETVRDFNKIKYDLINGTNWYTSDAAIISALVFKAIEGISGLISTTLGFLPKGNVVDKTGFVSKEVILLMLEHGLTFQEAIDKGIERATYKYALRNSGGIGSAIAGTTDFIENMAELYTLPKDHYKLKRDVQTEIQKIEVEIKKFEALMEEEFTSYSAKSFITSYNNKFADCYDENGNLLPQYR